MDDSRIVGRDAQGSGWALKNDPASGPSPHFHQDTSMLGNETIKGGISE